MLGEREHLYNMHKLYSLVDHIWGYPKGKPNPGAMESPHPGRTA